MKPFIPGFLQLSPDFTKEVASSTGTDYYYGCGEYFFYFVEIIGK